MTRDLSKLAELPYDLLIIGGGINGACAAWDATLRGLSVALVEKGDFGAATSANSLKIIHGGLRYLQQLDIHRMRESIKERATLMRIAPHLVYPIPFLVPTYNSSLKQRKEALYLALKINDLFGVDRNRFNGSQALIPQGRVISRNDCLDIFPGFDRQGLTGGGIWYDCQVYNSERLTFSFLRSAAEAGAVIANYVRVTDLLTRGGRVCGAKAVDVLTGSEMEIRARMVLNTGGPWVHEIMGQAEGVKSPAGRPAMASALNLVVKKSFGNTAFCIRSKTTATKDPICGGRRFLFFVPWRGYTMLGTYYQPYYGSPDHGRPPEEDLIGFIDEYNQACPGLELSLEDVSFYHQGFLPLKNERTAGSAALLAGRHRIVDHAAKDGVPGLISVIGVKYTTARAVAEESIDLVFKRMGTAHPPKCKTSTHPIHGGDSSTRRTSTDETVLPGAMPRDAENHLARHHGSRANEVAAYARSGQEWEETMDENTSVLRCEVMHAVHNEMAVKLADVVFRRTELGTAACPHRGSLDQVARIMGNELGWDIARCRAEVDEVLEHYAPLTKLE